MSSQDSTLYPRRYRIIQLSTQSIHETFFWVLRWYADRFCLFVFWHEWFWVVAFRFLRMAFEVIDRDFGAISISPCVTYEFSLKLSIAWTLPWLRWGSRLLEGFVQEINRFTMAAGREESGTVKQWPGVIMLLSRGIWTQGGGGMWKRDQHSFFFSDSHLTPLPPLPS